MTAPVRSAILFWRAIDDSGSTAAVTPDCFRRQIETIATAGIPVVKLQDIRSANQSIALTFDGAYRTYAEIALPILESYGYPSTLFVSSGHCKRGGRYLKWDELRTIAQQGGVEIGAQGVTLSDWSAKGSMQLAAEMDECAEEISQYTGTMALALAYPFGRSDRRIQWLASQRFRLAVGRTPRFAGADSELFSLPRIDARYFRQLFWLHHLHGDAGAHWVSKCEFFNALPALRSIIRVHD